jgi:hypothetical protein
MQPMHKHRGRRSFAGAMTRHFHIGLHYCVRYVSLILPVGLSLGSTGGCSPFSHLIFWSFGATPIMSIGSQVAPSQVAPAVKSRPSQRHYIERSEKTSKSQALLEFLCDRHSISVGCTATGVKLAISPRPCSDQMRLDSRPFLLGHYHGIDLHVLSLASTKLRCE